MVIYGEVKANLVFGEGGGDGGGPGGGFLRGRMYVLIVALAPVSTCSFVGNRRYHGVGGALRRREGCVSRERAGGGRNYWFHHGTRTTYQCRVIFSR